MKNSLPNGVMLNAYPDSIGSRLSDTIALLQRPELTDVFSLFYLLPTFFNSDLDRGFSVIDYDHNEELVTLEDLSELEKLDVMLKLDLVLNHLSAGSPQFQDLLANGDASPYRDFFIDWNEFWANEGELAAEGHVVPAEEHLQELFMRKPGLPILRVRFPDGADRFFWNTFYQAVSYRRATPEQFATLVADGQADDLAARANAAIDSDSGPAGIELDEKTEPLREAIVGIIERNRSYLGQMDLNARSEGVWAFYRETLHKLSDYGVKILRLDAFAYLHKQVGLGNFFNQPGTWEYLDRLAEIAKDAGLTLLPEIHAEYGSGIHTDLSDRGYPVYDFFFPGLVIDALDRGCSTNLLRWIDEILDRDLKTVNMLGCHDGIPVIDLRRGLRDGVEHPGLLDDNRIEAIIELLLDRGGRVKNLYKPDGTKISYYQVNATFFSALGEDENRLRLARAIQLFMPGTPQVWYLDLFAGCNDYEAADCGGDAGHKEINRTNLSLPEIEHGLTQDIVVDQLQMMRLRNTSQAFDGQLSVAASEHHRLMMTWTNEHASATLDADLQHAKFTITSRDGENEQTFSYGP